MGVRGNPSVTAPSKSAKGGVRRLLDACRYSYAGFRHALRNEAALRQEVLLFVVLAPVSAILQVTRVEHVLLVLVLLLVLLVEFLNSAIEAAVDRVSTEIHPLAAQAKDLGSAAVLLSLLMAAFAWVVIAGPSAWVFLRRLPR